MQTLNFLVRLCVDAGAKLRVGVVRVCARVSVKKINVKNAKNNETTNLAPKADTLRYFPRRAPRSRRSRPCPAPRLHAKKIGCFASARERTRLGDHPRQRRQLWRRSEGYAVHTALSSQGRTRLGLGGTRPQAHLRTKRHTLSHSISLANKKIS